MSNNPFLITKVNTLQDAFPTVDPTVLENTLWLENGDMNKTFERLLAMTDPSAAAIDPPPRTTPVSATTNPLPPVPPPRIRPPSISVQQRPLPTPPSRAKPNLQSVRMELAQWRQELSNDRDMRRTNNRSFQRTHSSLRSSTASNYEMQSSYKDTYSIRDVVNEGSAAALKAATSLYDRFLSSNSVYGNYSSPSHQSNNTNLYSQPSSSSSTLQTRSSNRPSLSSSINRPLPSRPQQNHTTARNPFDSSDDALPPPTYEAREHDTLIDPMDADHLLSHHQVDISPP